MPLGIRGIPLNCVFLKRTKNRTCIATQKFYRKAQHQKLTRSKIPGNLLQSTTQQLQKLRSRGANRTQCLETQRNKFKRDREISCILLRLTQLRLTSRISRL